MKCSKTSILLLLPAALLLLFSGISAQDTRNFRKITREEYIALYKDIAVEEMHKSGIPASITLAQACLESGDGNSRLAREANNHFGIKCHGWQGATIYHDDDQPNECFRSYEKPEDSFADHSDFLRYRQRYASLFELSHDDYRGWAEGLKKAGYATDPQYAERLIRIIEDNDLARFDYMSRRQVAKLPVAPSKADTIIAVTPSRRSPIYRISLNRTLYEHNKVHFILAESYDTYSDIAQEYNLFLRELLSFNDLKEEQPLEAGQIVYIERKRLMAAKYLDRHVVEEDETMWSISQHYAVRLRSLYKYNDMRPSDIEPEPGTIINIRPVRLQNR